MRSKKRWRRWRSVQHSRSRAWRAPPIAVIGEDTSERHNMVVVWSVGNAGFKAGHFYAKVRRTDACKPAFSDTISL